jgi:replicative DNA helicase
VVLAQLNRSIEKRTGNAARPTMSDLRESGEIEAAADFIGILYSKEESPNGQLDVPITMAIVKHRGGSTEDINFLFKKGYTRFCSTSKVD